MQVGSWSQCITEQSRSIVWKVTPALVAPAPNPFLWMVLAQSEQLARWGALTVRIPCQSPTSFLKSNTFTIVSAVGVKKERSSLTKEAQNKRQRKSASRWVVRGHRKHHSTVSLRKPCSFQTPVEALASLGVSGMKVGSNIFADSNASSYRHVGRDSSFYIFPLPAFLFYKGCFHFHHVLSQEMWGRRCYLANTLCCTREVSMGLG